MSDPFSTTLPYLKATSSGEHQWCEDTIVTEERITFYLNGAKILSTMSIPQHQDAHLVGFLLSENVIEDIDCIQSIDIGEDGLSVSIQAKIQEENLNNLYCEKTLTSGCCVGVTGNFEGKIIERFNDSRHQIPISSIWKALDYFNNQGTLFKQTGCVHRAIIFDEKAKALFDVYDIGRHNALDKVMGLSALSKVDLRDKFLFASGRLSLEMIIKAVMHNIPIIISKASTTKLAIQAAQKMGITLVGFARDHRCNIYTHHARILL